MQDTAVLRRILDRLEGLQQVIEEEAREIKQEVGFIRQLLFVAETLDDLERKHPEPRHWRMTQRGEDPLIVLHVPPQFGGPMTFTSDDDPAA